MNKKFLTVIILLLVISLVGAVTLQGLWINNEWQSKRENFDRDVREALNTVADRLETQETASFLQHRFNFGAQPQIFINNNSGGVDSGWFSTGSFTRTHVEFHSQSIYDIFDTQHCAEVRIIFSKEDSVFSVHYFLREELKSGLFCANICEL